MSSYQQVIICGNLGNDPETRTIGGTDTLVANISVATSEKWRDKQTGEQKERTEWHRVVAFSKLAEIIAKYLQKGSKVLITGQLKTRKWQAQDGTDRYTTEIVAKEMTMLGGEANRPQSAPQRPQAAPQAAPADDFDDDIPF